MNEITLHYLFSAIAQSAAAFIAFVAIFAIFRLQANREEIEEAYADAKHWLVTHHGHKYEFTLLMIQ